ncbi:MAG: 16S rRNA (guanine(527)-N(7))-methyltransferase RsmG [Rubrivivax sp.]|nr:16S rRNA (guanine(527)-N(7))-methyltransferase RsmG [Rubrivivax sp.]
MGAICDSLGVAAAPAQLDAVVAFLHLLRRWNATYNLTAVREPQAMLAQHVADCLAAVAALSRRPAAAAPRRVLDVGSGGGLPGVLIAIFRPEAEITCVDAVGKKAAFIRQVAGTLALPNLRVAHSRVESLAAMPFDMITARAFATLADLVRLTRRMLAEGGCWVAMKGATPHAEMAALPPDVEVFHVEPLKVPGLQAQRCLVWMRLRRDSPALAGG